MQLSNHAKRWVGVGCVIVVGLLLGWRFWPTTAQSEPIIPKREQAKADPTPTIAIGSEQPPLTPTFDLEAYQQQPKPTTAPPAIVPASQSQQQWLFLDVAHGPIMTTNYLVVASNTNSQPMRIPIDTNAAESIVPLSDGSGVLVGEATQLRLLDFTTGQLRWQQPFQPASSYPLVIDQQATGVYALDRPDTSQYELWRVRHLALTDGHELSPSWVFSLDFMTKPLLAADGSIWLLTEHNLTHLTAEQRFEPMAIWFERAALDPTGRLGVAFIQPDQVIVFDPITGLQQAPIRLALAALHPTTPIEINPVSQQLAVNLVHEYTYYQAVYDLKTGAVLAFGPTSTELIVAPNQANWLRLTGGQIATWDAATNQMQVLWDIPAGTIIHGIESIWPLAQQTVVPFDQRLAELPIRDYNQEPSLPPVARAMPKPLEQPIGLVVEQREVQPRLLKILGNGSTEELATNVLATLPRIAQAPLYLINPRPRILAVFNGDQATTLEIPLDHARPFDQTRFHASLSSDQQTIGILAFYDFMLSDSFSGTWQLAEIDRHSGKLAVLNDSNAWPELANMQLKASSQGSYYLQSAKNQQLWIYESGLSKPRGLRKMQTIQVSGDRQTMLTFDAEEYKKRHVVQWNLTTGLTQNLDLPPFNLQEMQLSPDGQVLLGTQDHWIDQADELMLYRIADQQVMPFTPHSRIFVDWRDPVQWSQDGRYFGISVQSLNPSVPSGDAGPAVTSNYRLYDLVSLQEIAHIDNYAPIIAVGTQQLVRYYKELNTLMVYGLEQQQPQLLLQVPVPALDPSTIYLYPR